MARFVNYDIVDEAQEKLKNVYYIDDDDNKLYFTSIVFEQIPLRTFQSRYPEDEPDEAKMIITENVKNHKLYRKLTVVTCIQDAIDVNGLHSSTHISAREKPDRDTAIFHFGKYKGNSIKSLLGKDDSYLRWVIKQPTFDLEVRELCAYWLGVSID